MPIPMVADCADYETYRSGKFIPGIMGTLFSLVDKLVSSLASTVVSVVLLLSDGVQDANAPRSSEHAIKSAMNLKCFIFSPY